MSAVNLTATFLITVLPNFVENVRPSFSWYDYILFSGMLTVSALIGVYFGCFGSKQATTDEYLMGSKRMKVFPISMSVIASHISGITLLAVPADIYRFGASYLMMIPAVLIVAAITIYVYLPVFFKLRITSTYEYLERRFDNKNRILASVLFSISLLLYLPIVIYIPALAFSAATGINVHLITPIVCGVCIFYTTIGGLKAVVWTDTLQFTITLGTVITVFYLGVKSAGGFGTIWTNAIEGERLSFLKTDLDFTTRDSFWIFTGLIFHWIGMTSIHQSCVQKFLSVSTLREANFFAGVTSGPLFGMFTLGLLFPKASSKGTFYGTLISLLVCCWFIFMTQYYKAQGFTTIEDKPISTEGCLGNMSTIASTVEYFNATTMHPVRNSNTVDFNNSSYLSNGIMSSTTGKEDFKPFWLFRISFYYYSALGGIFTLICGTVLSYILQNDDPPVDKDLLSPVIHPFLRKDMQVDKNNTDYYSVNKALHLITNNSEKFKDVSY